MEHLALRATVVSVAVLGMTAVAGPASAIHPHHIDTPGTCVDKAGAGFGTHEVHAPGSGPFPPSDTDPSFHTRVHKGTPGLEAFEKQGRVSVEAGYCP